MPGENIVLVALTTLPVVLGALAWLLVARWRVRAREPTTAGKLLLAALTSAFCAAAVLLALELFYRFAHDATDAFALMKTSQRWFDRHYQRNSWRLRDDVDYTLHGASGRRRVTFVGDSFTAGHGVPDVDDRFANLVRAARPAWDVQVLARNGLDTGAELAYLQDAFARGYRTDDLVLVYCPNDIGDLLPEWRAVVDGLYEDFRAAGPLVHHSYAVNHLYFRVYASRTPQLAGYFPRLVAAYAGAPWKAQARRLGDIARLAQANGARLSVVGFPFLATLGPDDPFADAYGRIARLWRALGVPYLDLRPALAGRDPAELVVNRYDAHPNEHAHALAADAIARFLDSPAAPTRAAERPREERGSAFDMATPDAAAAEAAPGAIAGWAETRRDYSARVELPMHGE